MVLPTATLVTMSLAFTVLAGPLMSFSQTAAQDLYERTPYLEAVLGEDRLDRVRDDLYDFTMDDQIDVDTGDDGAAEFAPVETSLQPDTEPDETDQAGEQ